MRLITKDVSHQSEALVSKILNKLEGLNKPRKYFMIHIMNLYMSIRGRYTFKGMSRYGHKCEKSYRLQFAEPFDYLSFNIELCLSQLSNDLLLAFDPSYLPKSGKHTPNLGKFWSGCLGKAVKGLEIGGLAVVDLVHHTAFNLEAIPTPCPNDLAAKNLSLVDHYAQIITDRADAIMALSTYLAVDGYFAKQHFIDPIMEKTNLHLISKLRADANLKYLYNGPKRKGKGRPKKYDGKVDTKCIDKSKFDLVHQDQHRRIYQSVVWSVGLKRKIKIAYVEFLNKGESTNRYAIFFSTDLELDAILIYQYYKARFQIEFLFRDAKQHVGLTHCQARNENKLHFHVNNSLTVVGLAKIVHHINNKHKSDAYSIADVKTSYFNERMLNLFFSNFQIEPDLEKNKQAINTILQYGSIAA